MLIRYWEQTRNLKSFVVLFQLPRVDYVEQNVIIACMKWPHESNHKPTVNKKMNAYICIAQLKLIYWPCLGLSWLCRPSLAIWSPSGRWLTADWSATKKDNKCDRSDRTVVAFVVQYPNNFAERPVNFGEDLRPKHIPGINLGKGLSIDPALYSPLLKPQFDNPNVT